LPPFFDNGRSAQHQTGRGISNINKSSLPSQLIALLIHFSQHAVLDEAAHTLDRFPTENIRTTSLAYPALSSSEIPRAMNPFSARKTSPRSRVPVGFARGLRYAVLSQYSNYIMLIQVIFFLP
jgi:hypothetical protein